MYFFLEWAIARWNDGIATFLMILGQSPQSFQGGAGWAVVEKLYPVFIAIGATLVPIFFLYSLVSETVNLRDKINLENIIKMLIRLGLSEWLVIHGIEIITVLFQSVGALISFMTGGISVTQIAIAPEVETMINNANWIESILPMAILGVAILGAYYFSYALLFHAYFRFFKIFTAVCIAPIAMAPLAGGTTGGTPRQFSKYIINITLEAAVMIIAIMIFTAIANIGSAIVQDTSNMWSLVLYFIQLLFGMSITVGGVKASENTIKQALGL